MYSIVRPLLFLAFTDNEEPEKEEDEVKAETCETARMRVIATVKKYFMIRWILFGLWLKMDYDNMGCSTTPC